MDEVKVKRNSMTIRGVAGLSNAGNTCYMNSIIQCLNNIPIFSAFVRSSSFQRLRSICSKKLGEDLNDKSLDEMCEKTITNQLQKLLNVMWVIKVDSDNNNCLPIVSNEFIRNNLKKVVDEINPFFAGYRQHDSQEFLNFVLDQVHMELGTDVRLEVNMAPRVNAFKLKYDKYKSMKSSIQYIEVLKEQETTFYKDYKREHFNVYTIYKAYLYWIKHIKTHKYSIITDMFTGLFHSIITCNTCGNMRNSFTPFTTMAIPIPVTTEKLDIVDCLNKFSESEVLSGNNMYMCKICKEKKEVTKKMTIWEPPECIVLHLERFKTNATNVEKISTLITFPLTGLSLDMCYDTLHPISDHVYDLYAVSNHSGSPGGGHYTAYAKNIENNHWYEFNDSNVQPIPDEAVLDEIVTKQAYILFYVRRL